MGPPGYVRVSPGRKERSETLLHEQGAKAVTQPVKERDEPETGLWRVAGHLHAVVQLQSFSSGWR